MSSSNLGWFLLTAGAVVLVSRVVGIPFGRLPGDVSVDCGNGRLVLPFTSMLLLSVIWSVIKSLVAR